MTMRSPAWFVCTAFSFAALLIVSCAGGPELRDEEPDWYLTVPEDTDTERFFRGTGRSELVTAARSEAYDDLNRNVLDAMDLGDPDRWTPDGREAVQNLLDDLSAMMHGTGGVAVDGVRILHNESWRSADGGVVHAVEIAWTRTDFEAAAATLAAAVSTSSPEYVTLSDRALSAEKDGNLYEAALLWAAAAAASERNANRIDLRSALGEIVRVLGQLEYSLDSAPAEAYHGLRPAEPVIFTVTSGDSPLYGGEFIIRYPRAGRDGTVSPDGGTARLPSDAQGRVRFLPPEVVSVGAQTITIAPSADPFIEYLSDTGDPDIGRFITSLETPRASAVYPALSRSRIIPTGILVLETDLAGNALNTTDAARGVLDDLAADGFDIGIINLRTADLASRTDAELLRDLKADITVSGRYRRVIHGRVSLVSFEQTGDTFTVRVSGTLSISDIDRQVSIYRSEVTKTSQASGSQQAISAAFRQLGRAFAGELISGLP